MDEAGTVCTYCGGGIWLDDPRFDDENARPFHKGCAADLKAEMLDDRAYSQEQQL